MIPVDAAFPLQWPDAEASKLLWRHDRTHAPGPVTPLTGDFGARCIEAGFNLAAESYALPLRVRWARFNTYSYQAVIPLGSSTDEMTRKHGAAEAKLRPVMARLRELWDTEWLPEVRAHHEFWDQFDAVEAPTSALLEHLDATRARFARTWEIHFLLGIPFLLAPSMFEDLYTELFGEERRFEAYQLVESGRNKTVESERALWDLSRIAKSIPEVTAILARSGATEIWAALRASRAAAPFVGALEAYLNEFGQRSSEFMEFENESWIEDPTPVFNSLQDYIQQPDRDRAAEEAKSEHEREAQLAAARAALRGHPEPVRKEFEALLVAAIGGSFLHSEHAHWIDQGCTYRVRRLFMEFGRRLRDLGALADASDVNYLTTAEIRETLSKRGIDRKPLVAARRAEADRFRDVSPPPVVGTMPTEAPPDTPIHRAITKFIGGPARRSVEGSNEILGNSASPGSARGVAKVVAELKDGGKLKPGDILVARTMAPPWAPLLASAAGIVTDTGGVLSHCAVIAREYRIPAVVGTGVATKRISDGQVIEVDGGRGVVRLAEEGTLKASG